jgi:hypothetical protein
MYFLPHMVLFETNYSKIFSKRNTQLVIVNAHSISANFLNQHYTSYKCMQIQMPTYEGKKYKESTEPLYWLSMLYPVSHCLTVSDHS